MAGFTNTDRISCTLYNRNGQYTAENMKCKSGFEVSAHNNEVFVSNFDEAMTEGFMRPLTGQDWIEERDTWIDASCEHASKFAGFGSDPLVGEDRDRFISTCKQSIKQGSDSVAHYDDNIRNRDIGVATAVSAAVNQMRANGRQDLEMKVVDDDTGSVVPLYTDVVQVYSQWFPQWNRNWVDDGANDHLGSEDCGFGPDDQRGTKCADTPSTNASAYAPLLSIQNICRRVHGLNHDLSPIKTTEKDSTHWLKKLMMGKDDFTGVEKYITDITNTESPNCQSGLANSFLCQFHVDQFDVSDREHFRRIGAAQLCEQRLRDSAYQQAPLAASAVMTVPPNTAKYDTLSQVQVKSGTVHLGNWWINDYERDAQWNGPRCDPDTYGKKDRQYDCPDAMLNAVDNPEHRANHTDHFHKIEFGQRVADTCAMLVNRVIDHRGLNMNDHAVDIALATCYRKEGMRYFKAIRDSVNWPEITEAKALEAQAVQNAKVVELVLQAAIAAGFAVVPGLGEIADMELLGPIEETIQQVIGRDTADALSDQIAGTDVEEKHDATKHDFLTYFSENAAYDIATAIM